MYTDNTLQKIVVLDSFTININIYTCTYIYPYYITGGAMYNLLIKIRDFVDFAVEIQFEISKFVVCAVCAPSSVRNKSTPSNSSSFDIWFCVLYRHENHFPRISSVKWFSIFWFFRPFCYLLIPICCLPSDKYNTIRFNLCYKITFVLTFTENTF